MDFIKNNRDNIKFTILHAHVINSLQSKYKIFWLATVTVAQLLFLEILFPKHKISTSFNHF